LAARWRSREPLSLAEKVGEARAKRAIVDACDNVVHPDAPRAKCGQMTFVRRVESREYFPSLFHAEETEVAGADEESALVLAPEENRLRVERAGDGSSANEIAAIRCPEARTTRLELLP